MFGRDDLVGRKLDGGRYELLDLIGRGGTSQVYAAKQLSKQNGRHQNHSSSPRR